MLYGADISHYNSPQKVAYSGYDFLVIKATEGKSWIDPVWQVHKENALRADCMIGFYHYARPEYNKPEQEAQHFVETLGEIPHGAILCLDYEQTAHQYGQEWALAWCNEVKRLTGCRPYIYLNYRRVKDYPVLYKYEYPLWLAKWSSKPLTESDYAPWDKWTLLQYGTTPIDLDKFPGTRAEWEASGYQSQKKSIEQLAQEVIAGKWGNGQARRDALKSAGYDYAAVQRRVNEILLGAKYYQVRRGDTLTKIARANNTTIEKLVKWNSIKDPNVIYAGQWLRVY